MAEDYQSGLMGENEAARPLEPGTVEWARNIELPPVWRPLKRIGQLAVYGNVFGTKMVGQLPSYLTRGDLVRAAAAHERAEHDLRIAYGEHYPDGPDGRQAQ